MILLDTNVLSAVMNDTPNPVVQAWLDRQRPDELWTTTVNVFEVRFGLARMPGGRRRDALMAAFEGLLRSRFMGRVAGFDMAAAAAAAEIAARRAAAGRTLEPRDTMIAGIAMARRAVVATRNTRHFGDLPLPPVDPWSG